MTSITRQKLLPNGAAPARNLVLNSENVDRWSGSATVSGPLGLNALGRFTGYALASSGAAWNRNEVYGYTANTGDIYCTTIWLRPGSSQSILLRVREMDTAKSYAYSGMLNALPAAMDGNVLIEDVVLSDGISRKLVIRSTMAFDGPARIELGANSDVSGEDLIVLAAQVEQRDFPTSYQFKQE